MRRPQTRGTETRRRRAMLLARLETLARMRRGFQEQQAEGLMTLPELKERLREIGEERESLRDELRNAEDQAERTEDLKGMRDAIRTLMASAGQWFGPAISPEERRKLYNRFGARIELGEDGRITLHWQLDIQHDSRCTTNAHTDVLATGKRAIYLSPLRALAAELATRWQDRFAESKVRVFTGDFSRAGKPYPVPFKDAQVLVMTPERLDARTRSWRAHWSWLPDVDLVVVDELHLLGDRHRGGRLEGAISRLRRLNPFVRLLGLSATLGNRGELADWFDGVEYGSDWRPVPLEWRIVRYRKADEKPEMLVGEVERNVCRGGKSLVFVQSRRRAEELGRKLQASGLRADHHHAGLSHTERSLVESRFRDSEVDVLVATSTLEMGLNLPVRQVILYDVQEFDGIDFRPLSTNSVWNLEGCRCGGNR